jgi:glycosyltransferase involved in cell wall biosynthesis
MTDRILFINYDFPPALAGVRRIVKMVQYMPENGFEPHVLAASPAASATLDFESLELAQRNGCEVWRTPSPDLDHLQGLLRTPKRALGNLRGKFDLDAKPAVTGPAPTARMRMLSGATTLARRLGALPDERFPWLSTAIPAAEHILRSRAIRYVVTSSYPNSAHLVGLHLKRKFNIHWHADFRDGWTQNPYFADYITPLHRAMNYRLEREVAQSADTLTAVSAPIAEYLDEVSGRNNVFLLPNGFDPTDLEDIEALHTDKFRLAYTGTMFMQRSPDSFFAAVRGLLDCYPGMADQIEIIFRSNFKPEHGAMIRDLGLEGVVQNWGLGTWREALALQKSADVLLVLEGENPNGHIMLTQKIFEYLATGKPILAVAPEGALADIVRHTRAGVVIHPDNVFRIKETLTELFLNRMKFKRNEEVIQSFTRQRQAAELAQILRGEV